MPWLGITCNTLVPVTSPLGLVDVLVMTLPTQARQNPALELCPSTRASDTMDSDLFDNSTPGSDFEIDSGAVK